jgi:hypothetical protein
MDNLLINKRKFIASSDLFLGYEVDIDISNCTNINDIINIFVEDLKKCLIRNNFIILLEKLNNSHFHIHDVTFNNIINNDDNMIYYLCDHI